MHNDSSSRDDERGSERVNGKVRGPRLSVGERRSPAPLSAIRAPCHWCCHALSLTVLMSCVLIPRASAETALMTALSNKPTTEKSATAKPVVEESLKGRISAAKAQIADTKAMRQKLYDLTSVSPAGVSSRENETARYYGDRLMLFAESKLRSLEALQQIQENKQTLSAAAAAWSGFPDAPPYSIQMVDELDEKIGFQRHELESLDTRVKATDQRVEQIKEALVEGEQAARRAAELSEAEKDHPGLATWRWKIAVLRVDSVGALLGWSLAEHDRVVAARALADAQINFLERQAAVARAASSFTETDLAQAQQRLVRLGTELEEEFSNVVAESERLRSELQTAREEGEKARLAVPGGEKESSEALDSLRVASARLDSARTCGEILTTEMAVVRVMTDAWSDRYVLVSGKDAVKRAEAIKRLKLTLAQAKPLRVGAVADIESFAAQQRASVERLARLDANSLRAERERLVLSAVTEKLRVGEEQKRLIETLERSLTRWLADAKVGLRGEGVIERTRHGGATLLLLLRQLWHSELFAVKDTIEIGGQMVSTERPVTFGKIASVALLILFGLWISRFTTRYIYRLLIEHYQVGRAQAEVLRRWINTLNAIILLLIGMYLVRIPLTVFAFLGGALAIGFGFGTQTLIKNLVSGALMFIERQIRAGDIVEISGIVGSVVAVDVRSTRVRGFDGKETVIPNSHFLESNVTNWTLTSRHVRLSVAVGVAHGSPTQLVSEVLLKCAQRHGEVLEVPPPFVRFQKFADSALEFELYFWTEIEGRESGATVASDLRFMIDKSFKTHDIELAKLQRDLHLDTTRPLQVEITTSNESRTPVD